MNSGDSKVGYGVISMVNHWLIGVMVISLIFFGLISSNMGNDPQRFEIIAVHKATGVVVLLLAVWRLVWRTKQGFPDPSPDHPAWQISAAKFMHWFLMVAIIAMPLSGLLWSLTGGRDVSIYGLFTIPAFADTESLSGALQTFHRLFSKLLIAGIVVHSAAGVYHAITDFRNSGSRMFIPK